MDLKLFMQKSSNVFAENRLLKFFMVVIGCAVVANIYMTSYALQSQRVIVVPPVVNSKLEISGDKVSDDYIKAFMRYTCALAFNYTPATARTQFSELLALLSPEYYPEGKKLLYGLVDSVEAARVSNSFILHKLSIDAKKSEIEVVGRNLRFAEDKKVEDTARAYIFNYKVSDGRFMITGLKEKEGGV